MNILIFAAGVLVGLAITVAIVIVIGRLAAMLEEEVEEDEDYG